MDHPNRIDFKGSRKLYPNPSATNLTHKPNVIKG